MKTLSFTLAAAVLLPWLGLDSADPAPVAPVTPAMPIAPAVAATVPAAPAVPGVALSVPCDLVVLPMDDGLRVGELLDVAQEVLGIEYFLGVDEDLRALSIPVQGTPRIPREHFAAFFEKSLRMVNLLHFPSGEGSGAMHTLLSSTPGQRGSNGRLKAEARVVGLDELATLSDRGVLVTTAYTTQYLPARDAVNTLSPFFADNYTDMIRNVEGTRTIVMTGSADQLASLVALLRGIDVAPQKLPERSIEKMLQRLSALEAELVMVKAQLAQRR